MNVDFNNARILITGWSGSWWNELTKQLIEKYNTKEIIIYSRWELAQVMMKRKFGNLSNVTYVIWDIRDYHRLHETLRWVDYVFHMAALKHVPVCEDNPWESVQTNVNWTENVIKASLAQNIKMVIDVSTDKACNPINVYGSCKSVWEKLIIQANKKEGNTKFVCVRAWNVMWTNGSIIPFFKELLKSEETLPITDVEMTRYFMTLQEAIGLLFKATEQCHGWETYVTKMPACKIMDLAKVLSKHYWREFDYKVVGIRVWEKLHEELISEYESPYTVEDENFRIALPQDWYQNENYKDFKKMTDRKYTSNDYLMNEEEIHQMLKDGWFLEN
jgi:FlaA1/EpsC-like NDP-sugar epimerase